ncbi:MAG TPA: hypothetical protein VF266_12355 [Thermoanaerobaculia bacterium]
MRYRKNLSTSIGNARSMTSRISQWFPFPPRFAGGRAVVQKAKIVDNFSSSRVAFLNRGSLP